MAQDEALGLRDVFVSSRPDGQALVVGGVSGQIGTTEKEWSRMLSKRAAHLLWFRLTMLLFPEKAGMVTAMVPTAPLDATVLNPTVTTHIKVERLVDNRYLVDGIMGKVHWGVILDSLETRRLWTALDLALYPDGWETTPPPSLKRRRQTYQ